MGPLPSGVHGARCRAPRRPCYVSIGARASQLVDQSVDLLLRVEMNQMIWSLAAVLEDGVGVATGLLWLLVGLRVAGRARGEGRGGRTPLTRTGKTKGAQHGNHSRKGAVDIAGLWTVNLCPGCVAAVEEARLLKM